jgi:single-strand DNA-binding protein
MLGTEVRRVTTSDVEYVNEVRLVGRVSGSPREQVLPSGDRLVSARVVVPRPVHRRRDRRGATVDTLDCVAWTSRPRSVLSTLQTDDMVSVSGALRRRFWRGEHGPVSKVEVEVTQAKRLRSTSRRAGAGRSARSEAG